jgi:hypothetical protein
VNTIISSVSDSIPAANPIILDEIDRSLVLLQRSVPWHGNNSRYRALYTPELCRVATKTAECPEYPCNKRPDASVYTRGMGRSDLKSPDRCIVTGTEKITRSLSAKTVVRLPAPIVVKIRGRESLVVGLALRKFSKRGD